MFTLMFSVHHKMNYIALFHKEEKKQISYIRFLIIFLSYSFRQYQHPHCYHHSAFHLDFP